MNWAAEGTMPVRVATKMAAMPSYRAKPSMLTEAPMGHMKRTMRLCTLMLSRQSMVAGRVAVLWMHVSQGDTFAGFCWVPQC